MNADTGKILVLGKALRDAVCWNYSQVVRRYAGDLPEGRRVRIVSSDGEGVTIELLDTDSDRPVPVPVKVDGALHDAPGYRFVVPLDVLEDATGYKFVPAPRFRDLSLVEAICAYEGGDMDLKTEREFILWLADTGLISGLQGAYHRAYADLKRMEPSPDVLVERACREAGWLPKDEVAASAWDSPFLAWLRMSDEPMFSQLRGEFDDGEINFVNNDQSEMSSAADWQALYREQIGDPELPPP